MRRKSHTITPRQWRRVCRALGPYYETARTLETVGVLMDVLSAYRRMCTNLQDVVQCYHLGMGGEKVDRLVCQEVHRLRALQDPPRAPAG